MITKDRCISILNMWINMIELTATDGVLRLTKKGTALLEDNLVWIREYLTESEDE